MRVLQGTLTPTGDLANTAKVLQTTILGDNSYKHPEVDPTNEISGAPVITGVTSTAAVDPQPLTPLVGNVPTGSYYYRLVFSDGPPAAVQCPLEGTPSAATATAVSVTTPGTNAVRFTGLNALTEGNYSRINFYRSTAAAGPYSYVGFQSVGTTATTDEYIDTAAAGTTPLNEATLSTPSSRYKYYVAYGKSGSEPSRPSDLIEIDPVNNGHIHITDLPPQPAPSDPAKAWDSWIIYRNAANTAGVENRYFQLMDPIPFSSGVRFILPIIFQIPCCIPERSIQIIPEIDMDGPKIQKSTLLSDVRQRNGSNYEQLFDQTGTLVLDANKGGANITPPPHDNKTMSVTTTSTVGRSIDIHADKPMGIRTSDSATTFSSVDTHHSGAIIQAGGRSGSNGRIQITGNNGEENALDVTSLKWASSSNVINMPLAPIRRRSVKAPLPI